MGLGEHLEELRSRLIWALLGLLPLLVTAMYFADQLMLIMLRPLLTTLRDLGQPEVVQNTGVLEGFSAYLKLSLVVTIVVGVPWIIYQLWRFVAPGLYAHERRFAYVLAPLSIILMIGGVLTLYFVMLPVALRYLVDFSSSLVPQNVAIAPLPEGIILPSPLPILAADPPDPQIGQMWINSTIHAVRIAMPDAAGAIQVRGTPIAASGLILQQYRLKEYLDLFFALALAFVAAYQLPVVVLLLGWAGIVNIAMLRKFWRHALVTCAIAAALLTPTPDPFSMLTLMIPMYLLYELGIVLLWLMPASRIAGKRAVSTDPQAGEG